LKEFLDLFNLKLLKERKLLIWTITSQLNASKHHLNPRIELGNNDFRNQRTRVNNKCYVAKNQTKMPVGVTFWAPVYLTIYKLALSVIFSRCGQQKQIKTYCVWTSKHSTLVLSPAQTDSQVIDSEIPGASTTNKQNMENIQRFY